MYSRDDLIYALCDSGLVIFRFAPLSAGDDFSEMPDGFSLSPIYPNPFNSYTTIEFSLLSQTVVSIEIFDILGMNVAAMVDHLAMVPGRHKLIWDAHKLASGVYFIRLSVNEAVKTQKAVLLR
jgi:hypothetical protein